MSQLENALERMQQEIATIVTLAGASEYQTGYQAGYGHGFASGSAVPQPVYPQPSDVLNKVASWLDAHQLPLDGAHQSEAVMRRRVTAFIRDLAVRDDFSLRGTQAAIKNTDTS